MCNGIMRWSLTVVVPQTPNQLLCFTLKNCQPSPPPKTINVIDLSQTLFFLQDILLVKFYTGNELPPLKLRHGIVCCKMRCNSTTLQWYTIRKLERYTAFSCYLIGRKLHTRTHSRLRRYPISLRSQPNSYFDLVQPTAGTIPGCCYTMPTHHTSIYGPQR